MLQWLIFLILLILAGYLILKLTLAILKWMAVNTIVGLILVGIINFLGVAHIELNLINLLIIAVGGVVGVFILLVLSFI
ncbi:MAG: pro-sigmaK processing inhibitor BofA family protein [Thermococcus sp.]|uniref:pro-sigmaK processing inhibitor BofA family protein n=1 Tax=Thermococcus sp. TaxID=35749 RepID=UPI001DB0E5E8|nr:pro-sigmaK processing inhibitor BofA family protein [Thermococcus sp.]MBO8174832.1 pro-sigmaK processing inhibitor BofA family protein [Thermococcus sp.]